jgi:hypothetical protein
VNWSRDENDPEWKRANVSGAILAGRLFCWLASSEGRTVCEEMGQHFLPLAARDLSREDGTAA